MQVLKFIRNHATIPGIVFLIALGLYRQLLLHINTYLFDWFDYPYYAWTVSQNIQHLSQLSLNGFFNTNIFYPFQGSLLFSDLLLPQSLLALVVSVFTKNPLTILNITFLLTLLLNSIASYTLWKQLFTDKMTLFFATFVGTLSPFFFLQASHFQMITLWPFFLTLALIFSQKPLSHTRSIACGLLVGIQFLASVYLAVFLITTISLYFGVAFVTNSKKLLVRYISSALVMGSVSVLIIAPFAYKYIAVQKSYHVERTLGEYITYSAHTTDYLFTNSYQSLGAQVLKAWNRFDKHTVGERAAFPSFALMATALISLFAIKRTKGGFSISTTTFTPEKAFFALLIITGLFFSFGPRLSSNGSYLSIPLPYFLFLKLVPIFEPIRALARWSMLLYMGVLYFALLTISAQRSQLKRSLLVVCLSILYAFEVFPQQKQGRAEIYYPDIYAVVEEQCKQKPLVLLELPFDQNKPSANVATNLSYKTKLELASVHHGCMIINGYSGYEPLDYIRYYQELEATINENDQHAFFELLDQRNTDMIKLNKQEIEPTRAATVSSWLTDNAAYKTLHDDQNYLLIQKHTE
jgi:hypothetical protein